jgi:hypothetical protein
MFRYLLKKQRQASARESSPARGKLGLRIALWVLWTLCVVVVGYINWQSDFVAQRPTNLIGLVIHCVLAGLIGLIVLTKIEMWLEPWRFLD